MSLLQYLNILPGILKISQATSDVVKLKYQLFDPTQFYTLLQDFMTAPIISEDVFNQMDKNKDGFVSKGNVSSPNI